jgi:predicted DsbA family dithiol-disulfide isomerase
MTTGSPTDAMLTVDVVSDVVCPWCYIGKRRLEAALATLSERAPAREVRVRWHPFQLNPDVPESGIDRREYVERKFGGAARAAQVYDRVRNAGLSVDIPFAFDAIKRQPNTRDAHRLIAWAQSTAAPAAVDALVERLFRAYFLEGRYVGDRDELARLAAECGLDSIEAQALLESDRFGAEVRASNEHAHAAGIDGVPFFIFDGKVAVGGAQTPDILLDAIDAAAQR